MKLIEAFKDRVPSTLDFNTPDDLKTIYRKFPKGGQVMLWCDGRAHEGEGYQSRKRKRDKSNSGSGCSTGTNRLQNVEETYKKLLEKHADAWDTPRLRLWARMISSGCHGDYDNATSISHLFYLKNNERILCLKL